MKKLYFKSALNSLLLTLFLLAGGITISSCYKDKFDLDRLSTNGEWAPDVVAPLVHSELTIRDLLNDYDHDNLFVEDATQFLYLVYTNKVYSHTAEEFFQIPSQYINTDYVFSVSNISAGNDYNTPQQNVAFSFVNFPQNQELQEAELKSGMLLLSLSSPPPSFNHNITINIFSSSITKNGIPLNEYINFPSTSQAAIDLSGYKITFTNTVAPNTINITYSGVLHANSSQNDSPYTINIGESLVDLKYSKVIGDFKQIPFVLPSDSVRIRLFNNNLYGAMFFEDPKIHLYASNTCGMPVRVNLDNFRGFSYQNAPYQEYLTGVPIPWDITGSPFSMMGTPALSAIHLDKTNSNVQDVLTISPQYFITDVSGISNPGSGPNNNFLLDNSRFDIDVQVELPLWGRDWYYALQDTIDFEFTEDLDKVEWIRFRTNVTNGLPGEAMMQIYFIDENRVILDSLYTDGTNQIIAAAPAGGPPDYRVYQPTHMMTETEIAQPRLSGLERTKRIIIHARLRTVNNGTQLVKFYSDYIMDVRLGARAKFRIAY